MTSPEHLLRPQDLRTPATILFGPGRRTEVGAVAVRFGRRALLLTGSASLKDSGALSDIRNTLFSSGVQAEVFSGIGGEPTVAVVEEIRRRLKDAGTEVAVAVGGGSVIDAAKAACGLVNEDHPVAEYQWDRKITGRCLPLIALPTTSGTGAEVTPNAVITDPARPAKRSIRHPAMMPRAAMVDPELTYSCPKDITAAAGLDALVQAVESHTSNRAGAITRALSSQAIRLIGANLVTACSDDPPHEARVALAAGSLLAGIALANAGLGAVHGLAHPVGARFGIPHGLICGLLFPHIARLNEEAVGDIYEDEVTPCIEVADADEADTLAVRFEKLLKELGIEPVLHVENLPREEDGWWPIVAESMDSGSFRANPRPLSAGQVRSVLEKVLVA